MLDQPREAPTTGSLADHVAASHSCVWRSTHNTPGCANILTSILNTLWPDKDSYREEVIFKLLLANGLNGVKRHGPAMATQLEEKHGIIH